MGLKDLFIVPDGNKPVKESKKTKNEAPAATPAAVPTSPLTSQVVTNLTGVADEKFVEILMAAIAQNNIPGQDYFEFKQTLDEMTKAGLAMDERSKFVSIFINFKMQGCSKEILLNSIDKYISVVKAEESNFESELVNQRNALVTDPLAKIEEAKKKVEELNRQIAETNNFIITSAQEVQNADLKLQMTAASFKKSVEKVVGMLTTDKEKINVFIQ